MATARRLAISTLGFLGVLALSASGPNPDAPDNWQELRSMPLELRTRLGDQIEGFDKLPRDEKEAVRSLDRKIMAEPEENRAIYFAVLRRYHLWVESLTEAQRNELNAAPPSKRMALVTKLYPETPTSEKPDSAFYHYVDFGGASPFDLAQRIKVWMALSDKEKAEISKLPDADRVKRMSQLARDPKYGTIERPNETVMDAIYERAKKSGKFPFLKNAESSADALKKTEKAKEARKQSRIKHRFVDNYYFVENPPKKVLPDKLLQFDRALPSWVRGSFDTLPPEESRLRLTILYRLIYPKGEMDAPRPKGDAPPAAKAPARPATPKKAAPSANPF